MGLAKPQGQKRGEQFGIRIEESVESPRQPAAGGRKEMRKRQGGAGGGEGLTTRLECGVKVTQSWGRYPGPEYLYLQTSLKLNLN